MKKAAIYARVSTIDKNQDPETQLRELRDYCERVGWEYTEYVDYASGATRNRQEYKRLMDDADRRRFDVLVVWSLSRFGRSMIQLIEDIHLLAERNIEFRCHSQALDTTTPNGKLLFHVVAAFTEYERELISENVKLGLERAKSEGKTLGRPTVVTDFTRRKILEATAEGLSQREIAKKTRMSRSVVQRVLWEERIIADEDAENLL